MESFLEEDVSYAEVAAAGPELPGRARARVLLDVVRMNARSCDRQSIERREPNSRLVLSNVRVGRRGALVSGAPGGASGLGVLVWEILVGRPANRDPLPRVHDVVDEVPPDLDDVAERAVRGRLDASALLESVAWACEGVAASAAETFAILSSRGMPAGAATEGPRVLVVGSRSGELARRLVVGGYIVRRAATAQQGVTEARTLRPHCVVTDLELPGGGGLELVRVLRAHPGSIGTVPIALVVPPEAPARSHDLFARGVDVLLRATDDAASFAQIAALCDLRRRIVRRPVTGKPLKVFSGHLEHVAIASVLTALELERRSGTFEVLGAGRRAVLRLLDGRVVADEGGAKSALATVRTMLTLARGRFCFTATPLPPDARPGPALSELLVEALRQTDEAELLDGSWSDGPSPPRQTSPSNDPT